MQMLRNTKKVLLLLLVTLVVGVSICGWTLASWEMFRTPKCSDAIALQSMPQKLAGAALHPSLHAQTVRAVLPAASRFEFSGEGHFQLAPVWTSRATRKISWPDGSGVVTVYPTTYLPGMTGDWWYDVEGGIWEPSTFKVLRTLLTLRSGAYIDFGSWIGPTALYAAQYASRVIAMDPDPWAFEMLMANFKANPSLAAKADVFFLCISAQLESVSMHGEFPGRGGSGASAAFDRFANVAEWVAPCMPLGALLLAEGLLIPGGVAALKIDTEGAELDLFPALLPTLRAIGLPPVWFSLHHAFWTESSDKPSLVVRREALLKAMDAYTYWYTEDLQPAARHAEHYVVLLSPTPIIAFTPPRKAAQ